MSVQPTYRECRSLEELWAKGVFAIHEKHFPGHELMPIMGNGQCSEPEVMFVFINPTHRNASSVRSWMGPRFPFIGTKQVWSVFHRAGLLGDELAYRIRHGAAWDLELTRNVLRELQARSLYLTNVVKWTGHDAALPAKEMVELFMPILQREIEIVRPRRIVAFGQLPFTNLTRLKVKLADYYADAVRTGVLKTFECAVTATGSQVVPCYFPVGRGNPSRAVDLLKLL